MRKLSWAALALVFTTTANVIFVGCGSDPEGAPPAVDGGDETSTETDAGPGTNDATVVGDVGGEECKPVGEACTSSLGCCTGNCTVPDGGGAGTCAEAVDKCKAPNDACNLATECCTKSCVLKKCWDKQCVADNGACNLNEECCSQTCTGNKCVPITDACKSEGNPCTAPGDCCSKQCNNGVCGNGSFCTQTGDICAADAECCGGKCTKAAGAAYGLCAIVPGGPGSSCNPEGTVCGSGGDPSACENSCCSKACGPWGTTGIRVCQPASGCSPTYEICTANGDCCGAPPNPSLSNFTTSCAIPSGETSGRCTLQNQCDPPGGICKISTEACGVQNRCCDPEGVSPNYCQNNPDNCCRKDALGIPRCIIKVVDCDAGAVAPGTACATSADCCGKPCVNNKCEGTCVASGGACTTASDCCPGLPCENGKCGVSPTTDAGNCALYGQTCSVAGDCCNGVPCTSGTCRYP